MKVRRRRSGISFQGKMLFPNAHLYEGLLPHPNLKGSHRPYKWEKLESNRPKPTAAPPEALEEATVEGEEGEEERRVLPRGGGVRRGPPPPWGGRERNEWGERNARRQLTFDGRFWGAMLRRVCVCGRPGDN